MLSDKKVRRGILRFVLLDGIANPGTVSVDPQELQAPASQIGIRA
jgi:3-dehydroquinate synthase